MERTQIERERRPPIKASPIEVPKTVPFDADKIQALWREVMNVRLTREYINASWDEIQRWERRK
jgi:hypothetical protein